MDWTRLEQMVARNPGMEDRLRQALLDPSSRLTVDRRLSQGTPQLLLYTKDPFIWETLGVGTWYRRNGRNYYKICGNVLMTTLFHLAGLASARPDPASTRRWMDQQASLRLRGRWGT